MNVMLTSMLDPATGGQQLAAGGRVQHQRQHHVHRAALLNLERVRATAVDRAGHAIGGQAAPGARPIRREADIGRRPYVGRNTPVVRSVFVNVHPLNVFKTKLNPLRVFGLRTDQGPGPGSGWSVRRRWHHSAGRAD